MDIQRDHVDEPLRDSELMSVALYFLSCTNKHSPYMNAAYRVACVKQNEGSWIIDLATYWMNRESICMNCWLPTANMNRKDMHRQKKIYSRCKEASDDNKSTTDIALELQGNVNTLGCCPTDVHKLVSMKICDIQDIEVLRKVKLDRLEEQRKHNEKKRNQRTEKSLKKINKK